MKIYNVVAFDSFGTISLNGDGSKMEISLTEAEAKRVISLAREIFLERQRAIVAEVEAIPPGFQLEAPKTEPEYTPFTPVDLDDVRF